MLVTFTTTENLARYRRNTDLPYRIVVDPERVGYRAYGLGRGSVGRIYGWRSLRRYVQIFRRREPIAHAAGEGGLRKPTEDTLQLGGDFVVAPDGTLAWGFWSRGPDDRPSVDELVAAVAATIGSPPVA